MNKYKYRSAKIVVLVDDNSVGKNQVARVGEFVGKYIPNKLNQLVTEAKIEFPFGKIRYHLIVKEYVPHKRLKFLGIPKFKRVTLSDIDINFE